MPRPDTIVSRGPPWSGSRILTRLRRQAGLGCVVDDVGGQRRRQLVPLAPPPHHRVTGVLEHLVVEIEAVANRPSDPGLGRRLGHDAVVGAVDEANRDAGQLAQRLVRRQPRGQPDDPDDTRQVGHPQRRPGTHGVADQHDRAGGESGAEPLHGPPDVALRGAAGSVPASNRQLKAEDRQRAVAACDRRGHRAHPQGGELPPPDRGGTGRPAAVDDQDNAADGVRDGRRQQVGVVVGP